VDPTVGPDNTLYAFTEDEEGLVDRLVEQIRQLGVQAVFSHGSNGEYGHPAHLLCNRIARRTIQRMGRDAPLLYTIQAAFKEHPYPRLMNKDDPAHLVLDVSGVREAKVQAALCHRTQHALFIRNTSKELGHPVSVPEVILGVESLHRAWPPLSNGEPPDDPLARLFIQTGTTRVVDSV
jgi:LmbE family N-acetylglucosaminyl deacetylase